MTKLKCIMPTYGLTVGKLYDAVVSNQYDFIDDNSMPRYHSKEALVGCFEVVEDDATTIKREGVVALLPECSEFKIGQEVFVNMYLYKGVATIKGYNYAAGGYVLETPTAVSATPHHNGLCKTGHALWAIEGYVKAIVPTKAKKWGKWIENKTGECPVGLKRKQKVKLKWSDGDEFVIDNPQDAGWYFSSGNNPVDITHYKVKLKDLEKVSKPPKNPKSKWSEWIEHTTGNIPKHLAKDDIVKVKLRGLPKGKPFVVDTGCWVECGEYTIMKYKVKLT